MSSSGNVVRVAAAGAALLTALLLQATLVGPAALALPVSLPAVLVAAVALVDGPGAGIAFGFAAGLVADLGSAHPAGVLALCWLAIGVGCGMVRSTTAPLLRDVALAGAAAGTAGLIASIAVAVLDGPAGVGADVLVQRAILATLLDVVLALVLVPLVRAFLHSTTLRAPRPVLLGTEDR